MLRKFLKFSKNILNLELFFTNSSEMSALTNFAFLPRKPAMMIDTKIKNITEINVKSGETLNMTVINIESKIAGCNTNNPRLIRFEKLKMSTVIIVNISPELY